jgi:hypothetical protein
MAAGVCRKNIWPQKLVVCAESAFAYIFAHVYSKLNRDAIPRGRSLWPDVGGNLVPPVPTDSLQFCHLSPLTACNIVSSVSTDSWQFCHLFSPTACSFTMSPLTACNRVSPVSTDSLQYFITSIYLRLAILCHFFPLTACNLVSPVFTDSLPSCFTCVY